MVSPHFFIVFSEQPQKIMRLALRLIRDYDVISGFRILRINKMMDDYGRDSEMDNNGFSVWAFENLITIGFLERGPVAKFAGHKKSGYATYRVHPSFLLNTTDLEFYLRNQRDTVERMGIAPKKKVSA